MDQTGPARPSSAPLDRERRVAPLWPREALRPAAAAVLALVVAGTALRTVQFVDDPSPWGDEIALALPIVEGGLGQLVSEPLPNEQVAPPGFLAAERLAFLLAGPADRALRIVPFLTSLLALGIGAGVAWTLLPGPGAVVATGILAFAPQAVHFAAVVKQYSSDMLVAVAVLGVVLLVARTRPPRRRLALGAAAGALCFFSTTATLVVAGAAAALLLVRPRAPGAAAAALVGAALAGGMAVALTPGATRAYMDFFWVDGYMPSPLAYPTWIADRASDVLPDLLLRPYAPAGRDPVPVARHGATGPVLLALIVLGTLALLVRHRRAGVAVAGTFAAVLGASLLRVYPIDARPSVFLLPILALAIGAALAPVLERVGRWRAPLGAAAALAALAPFVLTLTTQPPPYRLIPTREVLGWIAERSQPGDVLYAHWDIVSGVQYYGRTLPLPARVVGGGCYRGDNRAALAELDALRGEPRVWIAFGKVFPAFRDREAMLGYLRVIGREVDGETFAGRAEDAPGSAHLFDLSDPARLAVASATTWAVPESGPIPRDLACDDVMRRRQRREITTFRPRSLGGRPNGSPGG